MMKILNKPTLSFLIFASLGAAGVGDASSNVRPVYERLRDTYPSPSREQYDDSLSRARRLNFAADEITRITGQQELTEKIKNSQEFREATRIIFDYESTQTRIDQEAENMGAGHKRVLVDMFLMSSGVVGIPLILLKKLQEGQEKPRTKEQSS